MSAMVLGKEMAFKKMQRKMLSAAWSIVRFVLIAGIGYYILYPLITKFSMCFMSMEDLSDVTVRLIPRHFTTENLRMAWRARAGHWAYLIRWQTRKRQWQRLTHSPQLMWRQCSQKP